MEGKNSTVHQERKKNIYYKNSLYFNRDIINIMHRKLERLLITVILFFIILIAMYFSL